MVGFFVFEECEQACHDVCPRFVPATDDKRGEICRCKCHFTYESDELKEAP